MSEITHKYNYEDMHETPDPNRPQRVRLWMPTGTKGKWEHNRITIPKILQNVPLTLKQKTEYLQTLIFHDVFSPKPMFRVLQANQKALMESRHVLMIRNQETLLQRNKNNVVIIKKQIELLRSLAEEILCEDTLGYLHSVIQEYEPYTEGIEWKTTQIPQKKTQAQKFQEWTQTRYSKRNN